MCSAVLPSVRLVQRAHCESPIQALEEGDDNAIWTITNRRVHRLPLSEGFYTSLQCWIAHIIVSCRGSLLVMVAIQQQALVSY